MRIFILTLFLINAFYNFKQRTKNIVSVRLGKNFLFIIFIFSIASLFMAYRFSGLKIDYLLAISSVLLLSSIIFSPGLRRDGFNIFMGSTTLIKFLPFDKIKNIKIDYSNNGKILLNVDAFSSSYKLSFDSKDKNKIEELIRNFFSEGS